MTLPITSEVSYCSATVLLPVFTTPFKHEHTLPVSQPLQSNAKKTIRKYQQTSKELHDTSFTDFIIAAAAAF